jgi:tRNA (Thr-GGU) A37 N-methylase
MKNVQDYINSDLLIWLHDNNFKYKQAKIKMNNGALENLYNDKFCLKIYDRLGHGFGVTINVADKYDESIYENDSFSLYWVFEYFKIKQTASFNGRKESLYEQNLPKLISDIKNIIPRLNQMTSSEWNYMKEWISKEARKQFK